VRRAIQMYDSPEVSNENDARVGSSLIYFLLRTAKVFKGALLQMIDCVVRYNMGMTLSLHLVIHILLKGTKKLLAS